MELGSLPDPAPPSDTLQHLATRLDPRTVGATLVEAAIAWPEREALLLGDRRATYAELLAQMMAYARGLIALGIQPGDHLGILMPNCWEYLVLLHAAGLIGAVPVAINSRYRDEELGHALRHSDIGVLFVSGAAAEQFDPRALAVRVLPELAAWRYGEALCAAGAPTLRMAANLGDPAERDWITEPALLQAGRTVADQTLFARMAGVSAEAICVIMFSSGTSALPKACMLSHRALTVSGRALADRIRLVPEDRVWNPLPFYHLSTMLPFAATRSEGACFIAEPSFDPGRALLAMQTTQATIAYPAFPTLTSALVSHPDFPSADLSRLRLMLTIGAPDLLHRFARAIPHVTHISCYGLTEGGGVCCYSTLDDPVQQRLGTCGPPIDSAELRITDLETGAEARSGEPGEIWVRGDCLFSGYYRDEAKTREVMTAEGWLRTGDLGSLDPDGRLIYRGRLKDMLKVGGENVAAVEIESFLCSHPAVKAAQVVGVPDDRLVEVAAAFVELQPGAQLTPDEVVQFCAGRLASFKIPRYVRFVDTWPMSVTKIQKHKLLDGFQLDGKLDIAGSVRRTAQRAPGTPRGKEIHATLE